MSRASDRGGHHHPSEYLHIQAWFYHMQGGQVLTDREQRRAAAHGAPLDVICFDEKDSRWFRIEECQEPAVRSMIHEHVRELVRQKAEAKEQHDLMIVRSVLIYSAASWSIGREDMRENRVEIAEAMVGEWLEKLENRRI